MDINIAALVRMAVKDHSGTVLVASGDVDVAVPEALNQ